MTKKRTAKAAPPTAVRIEDDQSPPDETTLTCSPATAFKPEKLSWLVEDWVSFGGLTFLDGDPGCGKSSIALDLIARLTRGKPMPGGTRNKPAHCLLLIGEDDPSTLVIPRLIAANADLAKVSFVGRSPDRKHQSHPRFPGAAPELGELIRRTRAKLILMDPFMSFLARGLSANQEADVRTALEPLMFIAQDTRSAFLMVRHPNKDTSKSLVHRGAGSLGISAVARAVLWAGEHPRDRTLRMVTMAKTNQEKVPSPLAYKIESAGASSAVRWQGKVEAEEGDHLAEAEAMGKRMVLEEAKRLLQLALKDGPKPSTEILKEGLDAGIGSRTLTEAKAVLGFKSRRKVNGEGKAYWEFYIPKK